MFGEQMKWTNWKDIEKWPSENKFNHLVKRMQLNNYAWMSSGEFGRCQKCICDSLRYAKDEQEALEIAKEMDDIFSVNYGLF